VEERARRQIGQKGKALNARSPKGEATPGTRKNNRTPMLSTSGGGVQEKGIQERGKRGRKRIKGDGERNDTGGRYCNGESRGGKKKPAQGRELFVSRRSGPQKTTPHPPPTTPTNPQNTKKKTAPTPPHQKPPHPPPPPPKNPKTPHTSSRGKKKKILTVREKGKRPVMPPEFFSEHWSKEGE